MGKLRDEAEALGIEIDGRWSNGTLQRKINEVRTLTNEANARETKPQGKMVSVRLLKHYKPAGYYEIVGHYGADEVFVDKAIAPAPFPGVAQDHKLWAGTVVRLPAAEARKVVENVVKTRTVERDPETKIVIGVRNVARRMPLGELHADWSEMDATGISDDRAA